MFFTDTSKAFIWWRNECYTMFQEPIFIGTRTLQYAGNAFKINVPLVVANALKWKNKDMLEVTIELDGSMKLRKAKEEQDHE